MNLLGGALGERQERTTNSGVVEYAPSNEGVLESDSALHVRATVIYGRSDGKETVVDLASAWVVFGDASSEKFEEGLGSDTAVPYKHTVDVKHGVQEVFVVACENVLVGEGFADSGDLSVPSAHVADTGMVNMYWIGG